MFAISLYLNPVQQSVYAASAKTSDLKQDVKQNINQDNQCNRVDGCKEANEGQEIVGNDNAAAGINDQSTTNANLFPPTLQHHLPGFRAHPVQQDQ